MCEKCESTIAALKAANADKDKFISHLSHELAEATDKLKAIAAAVERTAA